MKRVILLFIFLNIFFITYFTYSNENEQSSSFALCLSQDPAFGFYPSISGSLGLSQSLVFTFYGIFWTQDILGGKQGGTNLFTEFGVGLGLYIFNKSLYINPSIGICGGNFQSGGGRAVIADAICPNLNISYSKNKFSLSFAFMLWKHIREVANITPYIDQYEFVLLPSYSFSNNFNLGIYYDYYFYYSYSDDLVKKVNGFMWLGPLVKFSLNNGLSLSFAFGLDFVDYLENINGKQLKEFYKMVATLPF